MSAGAEEEEGEEGGEGEAQQWLSPTADLNWCVSPRIVVMLSLLLNRACSRSEGVWVACFLNEQTAWSINSFLRHRDRHNYIGVVPALRIQPPSFRH